MAAPFTCCFPLCPVLSSVTFEQIASRPPDPLLFASSPKRMYLSVAQLDTLRPVLLLTAPNLMIPPNPLFSLHSHFHRTVKPLH
jgi:hypothetical protein